MCRPALANGRGPGTGLGQVRLDAAWPPGRVRAVWRRGLRLGRKCCKLDAVTTLPAAPAPAAASASVRRGSWYVRRLLLLTEVYVVAATAVISLYLVGLLDLSPAQWKSFFQVVAAVFVVIVPAMVLAHRSIFQTVARSLNRRAAGTATRDDLRRGFAAVCDFPRYWFVWGIVWWGVGGVAVATAMAVRDTSFGLFQILVVVAGTLSACLVTDPYYYFATKRFLAPVRAALAADLGDIHERRGLTRRVSIRSKLLVAVTSVILVTTVFAALLARAEVEHAARHRAAASLSAYLEVVAEQVARSGAGGLPDAMALGRRLQAAGSLALLDPGAEPVLAGDAAALAPFLSSPPAAGARGETQTPDGNLLVAWQRPAPDGPLLVAGLDARPLRREVAAVQSRFALLLVFATLVGLGVAFLLAQDIGLPTQALRANAARVASGDLTPGAPLDSEDDLGELGQGFEQMAAALRSMVSRVSEAATRVDATASQIADVTQSVLTVAAEQIRAFDSSTRSMQRVDVRARDIESSARALSSEMAEITDGVQGLDHRGVQLNAKASKLRQQVAAVAASVEEMARSVDEVATSADSLATAADETTRSMEQAAGAVRTVHSEALHSGRLSDRMVADSAEGRERVRETIEGMQAIRQVTDAAADIIGRLAQSSGRIDAVLDVIDGVADATKLLALNAAIIASQAGEQGRAFSVVADENRRPGRASAQQHTGDRGARPRRPARRRRFAGGHRGRRAERQARRQAER